MRCICLELALQLKATPYVQAYGQTEAKVIPQISLGITAFEEKADIVVRAESTAYLRLKLEADTKSIPIYKRDLNEIGFNRRSVRLRRKSAEDPVLGTRTTDDPLRRYGYGRTPSKTTTVMKRNNSPPPVLRRRGKLPTGPQPTAGGRDAPDGTDTSKGPAFNGCVWVDAQLDMNVGTESRLFDFFDRNTKRSFFKHTWTLWKVCTSLVTFFIVPILMDVSQECFGTSQHKKRALDYLHTIRARSLPVEDVSPPELSSLVKRAFGLKCLSTSISAAAAEILTSQNVQFAT